MGAGLQGEAFARAFPFHLWLDDRLVVLGFGASLGRAMPGLAAGDALAVHFDVRRPLGAVTAGDFHRHGAHLVTLKARAHSGLTLRGNAEQAPDGGVLLVVSPVLTSIEAVRELGLNFDDFARHDAVADLLLLARSTQMAARDAEGMALRLQTRGAQLDTILELGQNGVALFDADGRLQHANRAWRTMLQWSDAVQAGAAHGPLEERLVALRDPADEPWPLFVIDGEDAPAPRELRLVVPRPAVLRLTSRRAPDGGRVFYLRDVTHETEVDRMKSEFLTTAAHELRTPMVSVYGFTELLLNRPVPEARRREMLETIHRQSGLLITMVNELLDLARIEARQGKDLARESQPLAPLLKLAADGLRGTGDRRRLQLLDRHPQARVCVDAEKFHRAVTNVLSNAFKYSPGGGEVRLETVAGPADRPASVGVRVTDAGIGMTPEQVARIFDRFYRADPSGHIPGTGLGMSLVKEIVELHGGQVDVGSKPGRGTAVTLWWPLCQGEGNSIVTQCQAPDDVMI